MSDAAIIAPPGTVAVKRDGSRGYHFIDLAKYEASPESYELLDAPGLDLTREGIAVMKRADVVELLEAHGVEDTKGKPVAELRELLCRVVFIETE